MENLSNAMASASATAKQMQLVARNSHRRLLRLQYHASDNSAQLLCCLLLPPLGVFLQLGFSSEIVLSLLLTLLGFVPGVIHVLYILTSD